jgi:hypothetical protein
MNDKVRRQSNLYRMRVGGKNNEKGNERKAKERGWVMRKEHPFKLCAPFS